MKRLRATLVYLTVQWGIYFLLVYAIGSLLDYLFYADNSYGITVYYYDGTGTWPHKLYMVTPAVIIVLPVIYYIVIRSRYNIQTIAVKEYFIQLVLYLLLNAVCSVSVLVVYELSHLQDYSYVYNFTGVPEIVFGLFSSLSFFVVTIGKLIWDRFRQ